MISPISHHLYIFKRFSYPQITQILSISAFGNLCQCHTQTATSVVLALLTLWLDLENSLLIIYCVPGTILRIFVLFGLWVISSSTTPWMVTRRLLCP